MEPGACFFRTPPNPSTIFQTLRTFQFLGSGQLSILQLPELLELAEFGCSRQNSPPKPRFELLALYNFVVLNNYDQKMVQMGTMLYNFLYSAVVAFLIYPQLY
jgi:hypothetical protein